LRYIHEKRERTIIRYGGCQVADHLRRKVLPFVDDYVTITPGSIILKILLPDMVSDVIPVV
jgi:hypothetical protein